MSALTDMTLAGIQAYYQSGGTPDQLMASLRQQAGQCSEHNVFIHVLSEEQHQPFIDELLKRDPKSSPLWGVPFVLKDNIDLAGIPTTAGCEAFAYTPTHSAFVVQKLLDAGALPVGKANLDQFATGLNGTRSPAGPCRNSFDPALVSGGSSSGSAVSVGLSLASFSLGTDTAGSGRIPACFNNLVGVKPTRGLLSATGVVPACRSLDCVSIFALHADDANSVLSVVEGFDPHDGYSRSNPYSNRARQYGVFNGSIRMGVIPEDQLKFFGDEDYEQAYLSTLDTLRADGIELVDIDYTPFDEVARLLYEGPWVAERYVATLPLIEEQPEAVFPVVRDIISGGGKPSAADLFRATYRLQELTLVCAAQIDSLDALLTPTAGRFYSIEEMLEEPVRRNSELGYYMNFMNLLDMAAVSVPTAFTKTGLPFGITLGAPAFTDRRLLSIANRMQTVFGLTLAATKQPLPVLSKDSTGRSDWMEIVVCGAHMQDMPLNWQLRERGAQMVQATTTAKEYRLYAIANDPLNRPALVRVAEHGRAIAVEVWRLPTSEFGSFMQGIAAPLGLGTVRLADGSGVCGFIAEACATNDAIDVSQYGGWRQYLAEV